MKFNHNLNFTLICSVIFFKDNRKKVPDLNSGAYRPHLIIKGENELLGVCFTNGEEVEFDKTIKCSILPLYEGIDYSNLIKGTEFFIVEGKNNVGRGIIEKVFHHIPTPNKNFFRN